MPLPISWLVALVLLLGQCLTSLRSGPVLAGFGSTSQLTQPGTGAFTVGYADAGNQTALQAPNGTLETWGFDGAGRPISTTVTLAGTTLFSETATLDAAGQRVAIDDSWGRSGFGYDQAGRLTSATYPDGSSEADQYDAVGNRTVITSTILLATQPVTGTATVTVTATVTGTISPTDSVTPTATLVLTGTATPTQTAVASGTATPGGTPPSGTGTATAVLSGTATATAVLSGTATVSGTATLSPTATPAPSLTVTATPASSGTAAATGTSVITGTATPAGTATATGSATVSSTATVTGTAAVTITATVTGTATATGTLTPTDTATPASGPITGTTTLSTTVTTNTYDAADELLSSTSQPLGFIGPALPTTYAYDANGNQLGSVGPSGAITSTYDLQNQLIQVVGPNTNITYVYDGQGDRLRCYERAGPVPVTHDYAQDLAGGMSDLLSDGQQDYAYLNPGSGQAPLLALNQTTQRSAYLGTDLLGSVRLVTDPTGAVIGAGAYDVWGNARPNPDSAAGTGATLLAGLTGSQPFGFAGQYLDAGAGTYDMRAREYDPTQGLFLTQDPQPYDPQVPVTLDPYEYAGETPTGATDPSGRSWVDYTSQSMGDEDLIKSVIEQDFISRDSTHSTQANVNVQVLPGTSGAPGSGHADLVSMSDVLHGGQPYGVLYDLVPDLSSTTQDPTFSAQRAEMGILATNAYQNGFGWKADGQCTSQPHVVLQLGRNYPLSAGDEDSPQAKIFSPMTQLWVQTPKDVYLTFAWSRDPGIISYKVCHWQNSPGIPCTEPEPHPTSQCPLGVSALGCAIDLVVFNGIAQCGSDDRLCQGLALIGTLAAVLPVDRLPQWAVTSVFADRAAAAGGVDALVGNMTGDAKVLVTEDGETVLLTDAERDAADRALEETSSCSVGVCTTEHLFLDRYGDRNAPGFVNRPIAPLPSGYTWQAHHILQDEWARQNLAQFGYRSADAPAVYLVTGMGPPPGAHTIISNLQRASQTARTGAGLSAFSDSLNQELMNVITDWKAAGFGSDTINVALAKVDTYLKTLHISYAYALPSA